MGSVLWAPILNNGTCISEFQIRGPYQGPMVWTVEIVNCNSSYGSSTSLVSLTCRLIWNTSFARLPKLLIKGS